MFVTCFEKKHERKKLKFDYKNMIFKEVDGDR